jgi:diguanylate cyclase (GGDEF)-like protein
MPTSAILVLSPIAANRERVCDWLAPLAQSCRQLGSDAELWEILRSRRIDPPRLLVFDAHPPEESYSLINRLQGDPAGSQLPVLLLADNVSDSSRRFYTELMYGIETLPKPVDPEQLRAKVQALLAQDAARCAIEASMQGADWNQALREGLLALDEEGRIRYANRQAARWLRLTPLALTALNVQSLLEAPVTDLAASWPSSLLPQALAGQSALQIQQLSLWRGDGGSLAVQAALVKLSDAAFPLVFAFKPLEGAQAAAPSLSELARVDLLTGLPTRTHLEEAMAPLMERSGKQPALLLLDIDHLRHINETLGYDFGDQLLRAAAARLRAARESGVLASLGGGRFALLVEDVADYRVAGRIAQRLQAQFKLPFLLAGHEVFCSISAGIALYPASGDDPEQMLRAAERALERAKAVGRNVIQFDAAELNRFSIERLECETAFHQALLDNRLKVAWRLWRSPSGRVLAVQPRAVWPEAPANTPELGLLAEECGLSRELSDWLFRQAAQSSELPATLPLAFSVSVPQIMDPFVVPRLRAWLNRHSIAPSRVLLFIPWREDEAAVLRRRLPELATEGVRLALYLSGQGSALEAFAADHWQALVLGHDYVRRLPPQRAREVLRAMVGFGASLGWQLFAEGLPAGLALEDVFAAGVSACSEDFERLPGRMEPDVPDVAAG